MFQLRNWTKHHKIVLRGYYNKQYISNSISKHASIGTHCKLNARVDVVACAIRNYAIIAACKGDLLFCNSVTEVFLYQAVNVGLNHFKNPHKCSTVEHLLTIEAYKIVW